MEKDFISSRKDIEIKMDIKSLLEYIRFRIWHFFDVRKKGLDFEIELAGNCNLNCWGCNHFSPLIKNEVLSIENFQSDCERMGKIFNHKIKRLKLLGGEPLLNDNIEQMLNIARKNFRKGEIQIVTNGILLTKMPESFWKACRRNRIKINITKYPIQINYEMIKSIARKHKVNLFCPNINSNKYQEKCTIDVNGNQNIQYAFEHCYISKECRTLKNGKLYCCSFAPHLTRFRDYFGLDIKIADDDGIDIYKAATKKEIYDFLSRPIDSCRYCDVNARWTGRRYPWKISGCKMEEWTDII